MATNKTLPSFSSFQLAVDIVCALLGTLVIALNVPWAEVLSTSIPGGGDNPAHPVLMRDVTEAFLQHGSIIHYSFSFWSGFELFQFYFPLPYLLGGLLGKIIHPHIAFKLTTLAPLLLLPIAFYVMARLMSFGRVAATAASLVAVGFLHTEAHVMWGGNVSSTLAGMIGNMWAFVFFCVALGALFRARDRGTFSYLATISIVLAAHSHFYAVLMLFVVGCVFVIEDLLKLSMGVFEWRKALPPYFAFVVAGVIVSWWAIPLFYYSRYSTDFGGNWDVNLLSTFTIPERTFVCAALLISAIALIFSRGKDWAVVRIYLFTGIFTTLFFANEYLNSTAFINIRLWPSIYFGGYLLIIVALARLSSFLPLPLLGAALCSLYFLVPTPDAFEKARTWMAWNYSGIEAKPAASDFLQVVARLKQEPPGRVSFESADVNNGIFGTVRAFEMLPFLTPHEIIEGGILNSARFPGVAYFLQCLLSNTCAGWPAGTIMPGNDMRRAIEVMRMLGVRYHIAVKQNNQEGFERSGQFETLFKGSFIALYKMKSEPTLVEVYDRELPLLKQRWPYTSLLNQPRWDLLRDTAFAMVTELAPAPPGNEVDPRALFNFLVREWNSPRRVLHDLGWEPVAVNDPSRRINGYIFSFNAPFYLPRELHEGPDFFIADRGFDPDLYVPNLQYGRSEVALPLLRSEPGVAEVTLYGKGYFAFVDGVEVPFEKSFPLEFKEQEFQGFRAPYALIHLRNNYKEAYRYVDARTPDRTVSPGLPGPSELSLPIRITDECTPRLEKSFHQLVLHTRCPGKPHLIKYSYYPKWRTTVPIYLGSNGYMLLTPHEESTTLRHQGNALDTATGVISLLALLLLGAFGIRRATR